MNPGESLGLIQRHRDMSFRQRNQSCGFYIKNYIPLSDEKLSLK